MHGPVTSPAKTQEEVVAKLVIDLEDDMKKVIKTYAAKKGKSIKQVTMEALGLLIKELNKEKN